MTVCPVCDATIVPVSNRDEGIGRVAWWCEPCSALYPDGDYVSLRTLEVE